MAAAYANVSRLIEVLKGELSVFGEVIGFNMGTYVGSRDQHADLIDHRHGVCRTVACLAGSAFLLATGAPSSRAVQTDPDEIERVAREFLGIDEDTASCLFYDLPDEVDLSMVTTEEAIACLEILKDTGRVDWSAAVIGARQLAA